MFLTTKKNSRKEQKKHKNLTNNTLQHKPKTQITLTDSTGQLKISKFLALNKLLIVKTG